MLTESDKDLAVAMAAICTRPGNPVAWFVLEDAGISLEHIKKAVDRGEWSGLEPDWDSYPCDGLRKAFRMEQIVKTVCVRAELEEQTND